MSGKRQKLGFTIQNVPIKYFSPQDFDFLNANLQYKMFLLNEISSKIEPNPIKNLQYKMFLLNRNYPQSWQTVNKDLQYKMFLLNNGT